LAEGLGETVSQAEAEADAESLLGTVIEGFGYKDGCVVIELEDGRQLTIGADNSSVWWTTEEPTVQ
jgi:hypothetical protein